MLFRRYFVNLEGTLIVKADNFRSLDGLFGVLWVLQLLTRRRSLLRGMAWDLDQVLLGHLIILVERRLVGEEILRVVQERPVRYLLRNWIVSQIFRDLGDARRVLWQEL